jgi:hypothetical protein
MQVPVVVGGDCVVKWKNQNQDLAFSESIGGMDGAEEDGASRDRNEVDEIIEECRMDSDMDLARRVSSSPPGGNGNG